MNNFANPMKIIKTNETLLRHLPGNRKRNSFVIVSFDNFQKIAS